MEMKSRGEIMSERKRIVVIGAGYAGMLATIRLAGKTRHQNAAITLVNASDVFVERVRLHEMAANRPVKQQRISDMLKGTGVDFVQGLVTGIDAAKREISVQSGGEARQMGYDYLLYALGSTIDRESVPGVREYAYTLTPSGPLSAVALKEQLPALNQRGGRLIVCGGGTPGVEAAAEVAASSP